MRIDVTSPPTRPLACHLLAGLLLVLAGPAAGSAFPQATTEPSPTPATESSSPPVESVAAKEARSRLPLAPLPPAFPDTVTVRSIALDSHNLPLTGIHQVDVALLSPEASLLRGEQHRSLFEAGRFEIRIGTEIGTEIGNRSSLPAGGKGLSTLFAQHPEVRLRFSIDGRRQYPDVTILPAGHSPASAAALAGLSGAASTAHTRAYTAVAATSAVQAVTLRPRPQAAEQANQTGNSKVFRNPFELDVTYLGVSRPVAELPTIPTDRLPAVQEADEINRPRHENLFDQNGKRFGTTTDKIQDPLVDRSPQRGGSQPAPPLILDFAGVPNVSGVLPPDTESAVGPNHYIQVVNLAFNIFNKSGVSLLSGGNPVNTNTLWAGFGNECQTENAGDAIFLYDQPADRWVLTQFISSGNAVCFAVSQTGDPTGAFNLYKVNTARFPDYFKIGVWPDPSNNAYFLTTNSGGQGQYDVYAIDRENMIAGNAARPSQLFQSFPNLFMPADIDSPALPPAGSPGLLFTFFDGGEPYFGSPAQDSLELYEFDVDWTTPANTTFTQAQSFTSAQGFADFNWTVCGFFASSCLPQPGTGQRIDSASWWPMQRLVYRNFGSYETLLGSWTVDVTGNPDLAAPRWFELRHPLPSASPWVIHQQGTHSPDNEHRFMPSVAMDANGNIALGYSVTSSTTFPSIRYAVHEAGSASGTMSTEAEMTTGSGSQTSSSARWGDYASMELDPADDCTFWFTTEYLQVTGGAPWVTRVGTFKVPGCGLFQITPPSAEVCTTDGSAIFDIALLDAFSGSTTLSVSSGCPTGASCSLNPNPLNPPSTTDSQLTVGSLASVDAGSYTMTLTVDDGTTSANKDIALTLFEVPPSVPALTLPLNGATNVPVDPTMFTWTATGASSYTIQIATDAGFSTIVDQRTLGIAARSLPLQTSTVYYWRVRSDNACGQSSYSATFTFSTEAAIGDCAIGEVPVTLFSEDVESANQAGEVPGWTHSGAGDTWTAWSNRVQSGVFAFHSDDVSGVTDQALASPSISIPPGAVSPSLRFLNYQHIEDRNATSCFDGAILEISTNGGSTWTQVTSGLLTDPYKGLVLPSGSTNPLANLEAWCGDPQDWTLSIVDLVPYAGQTVRFRFRLGTDAGGVAREGWTLDDFEVRVCEPGQPSSLIFADGFESGDTSRW